MLTYQQSVKEVLSRLRVNPERGLSDREVLKRRKRYGFNRLVIKDHSLLRKILEPFVDIFMVVLLVALILCLVQREWLDATIIGIIIIINAVIYYAQQFSTDRILKSLRQQTVQQVHVLRNGEETTIDTSELVPGDIVILTEGGRIPADGRLLEESGLLTNEAMLTGESEPVAKNANKLSGTRKVYEQHNMVFSGSFVITGSARMLVTATGNSTEYGRIASLASTAESISPIQDKINRLVVKIAVTVAVLAAIILILSIIQQTPLIDSLKVTLAIVVSAVPEGLPIAISVVLALGAKRMAKKRALIREMRAIESIGIVGCIASDKTGTLTENHLSVQGVWSLNPRTNLQKYLSAAALPAGIATDPLDIAIHEFSPQAMVPIHSYAFDQQLKISGNLYEGNELVIKGSPETVIARSKLTRAATEAIATAIESIAEQGLKPIAIAKVTAKSQVGELANLSKSTKFTFVGLIAVADTLRPEASAAIRDAHRAGVAVKMVTGDHAETSFAIGRKLGLLTTRDEVYDCSHLDSISDDDLSELVQHTTVFARVTPEDKYRILTAVKQHYVTAMTGDGVNDVPALTHAHIGIAMGDGPSMVQDAGDIILLDNNFRSIIEAMKEGRVIIANIRRMLIYLLSTNAGEAITMTAALAFTGHHLLHPIQILWVNLVTDSLMVIPVGLEPPEQQQLTAKPEPKNAPILSRILITRMIIIALTLATVTLATYLITRQCFTHEEANTFAFTALVVMQWSSALNLRGNNEGFLRRFRAPNPGLFIALGIAIVLQIAALTTDVGHAILHTVPVPVWPLLLVSAVAFGAPILTIQLHKQLVKLRGQSVV
jgi:Ca2+-transporting ATPase